MHIERSPLHPERSYQEDRAGDCHNRQHNIGFDTIPVRDEGLNHNESNQQEKQRADEYVVIHYP
jgi:hypothetical protein